MHAIQFPHPGEARLISCPEPKPPGPGEALVRTHQMGICGTDLAGYLGKMPFFSYPRIPGHELGVEILAVGPDVNHLRPGDRCSVEPYLNDPASATSQAGKPNCCPGVQVLGVHLDGGLRERWICPARKLHPGNDLNYAQLALVETLAIGKHAVDRGQPLAGETVALIGAGPIGLACLEFLKDLPIHIIVIDRDISRLAFCEEHLGIAETIPATSDEATLALLEEKTAGRLANLVIDATGSAASMSGCFALAGYGGRVVYVGITTADLCFPHAPILHRRELTLLASRNALPADFPEIISRIRAGRIRTAPWITHRFPITEAPEAFARLTRSLAGTVKAMIEVP